MSFFEAMMSHPDGDGWNRHLAADGTDINDPAVAGSLRVSGPLIGSPAPLRPEV